MNLALVVSLSLASAGCLQRGAYGYGGAGSSGGPGYAGGNGDGAGNGLPSNGPPGMGSPSRPADPHLVVAGAGQGLTRVTADPVEEYLPVLSPDGSMLLFEAMT